MLSREEAIKRIDNMPIGELSNIIREALDESGIEYTVGEGKINWVDLPIPDTIAQF